LHSLDSGRSIVTAGACQESILESNEREGRREEMGSTREEKGTGEDEGGLPQCSVMFNAAGMSGAVAPVRKRAGAEYGPQPFRLRDDHLTEYSVPGRKPSNFVM